MPFDTTDTMRATIREAEEQARALNQEFVATEHLMLALLSGSGGDATRALRAAVAPDEVRAKLTEKLPRGTSAPIVSGHLPYSPKAQRTISEAAALAQESGQKRASTGFLLLALLKDSGSEVAQTLSRCGADLDALRSSLRRGPDELEP